MSDWDPGYLPSDIEALYERGNWHSWDELINWLDRYGRSDDELGGHEVNLMLSDWKHLRSARIPFSFDSTQTYRLIQKLYRDGKF